MLIANNLQHRKVQILRVYTSGHHAHDKGNTDRLQLKKIGFGLQFSRVLGDIGDKISDIRTPMAAIDK